MDGLETLLKRGYRYALALTHDRATAEDLLHDAWMGCLRRGRTDSAPYLIRAIRNRWIDQARRRAKVPMLPLAEEPVDRGPRLAVFDEVATALATLPDDEREALFLNAVEGWTAAEIGALQGRPRNTILGVLARARRRLREWRAERELEVL